MSSSTPANSDATPVGPLPEPARQPCPESTGRVPSPAVALPAGSENTAYLDLDATAESLRGKLFQAMEALRVARLDADESKARLRALEGHHSQDGRLADGSSEARPLPATGGSIHGYVRQAYELERSLLDTERKQARAAANQAIDLLRNVLTSRSWAITRPMRALFERLRGRRWTEPALPVRLDVASKPASPVPAGSPPAWTILEGLRFPFSPDPLVSVIVPAYGNLDVTLRCLGSIHACLPAIAHEVIVVEDHSGDADMRMLAEVPGLVYRENPRNLGFLRSCNAAVEQARGEFVCFLNNDTEVTAGWLEALLDVHRTHRDCGLAGSKLLFPDGRLQEAGGIIWADGSGWNFGRDGDPNAPEFNYVREVDYCSGAALMVRRELFRRLGGFDEKYAPAYYEDADLAFRVREQGLKAYYCPLSEVVHVEGASHGTDASQGIKAYQLRNQKVFRQRWRHTLDRRHYANGDCVFRAREHARHKRVVLVMDHTLPQPDRDAGSRAMLQTMIQLAQMGLVVKFWPDDHHYKSRFRHVLEDAGIEIVTGERWGGSFRGYIREFGQEVDFALLSRPNFAGPYVADLREFSRARIALFGHDIHHHRMFAQAEVTGEASARVAAEAIKALEIGLWREVDSIIYPSQEEADAVARVVGAGKAHAVPLYHFQEDELTLPAAIAAASGAGALAAIDTGIHRKPGAGSDRGTRLLFVAGFGHPPNVDAAEWLVRDILPRIRARVPDAILHLVGSHPTARVLALAGDRVRVSPNVSSDELEAHYRAARVAIAPLRFGGGVKLKVVEALARGVPLVTTSVGAQGLPGIESCIGIADDAPGLARIVTDLLDDPLRSGEIALAGHAYLREHYSAERMERALWRALAGAEAVAAASVR